MRARIGAVLLSAAVAVARPRSGLAQHVHASHETAPATATAREATPATLRSTARRTSRTPTPTPTVSRTRPREALTVMPVTTVRGAPPPVAPCLRASVEVRRVNGHATWTGALTDCEGHPTLHGLAAVSVLASPTHIDTLPDLEPVVTEIRRIAPAIGWVLADEHPRRRARTPCPPGEEPAQSVTQPTLTADTDAPREGSPRNARARTPRTVVRQTCRTIEVPRDARTTDPMFVLEGRVRVVHPRLLAMLDEVTRHFAGHRVEVISGYRPSGNPQAGSRHAHARALDYRLAGVAREALRDFAYTLPLAGVGYYPNSVFVHMDVRDAHEGSARWTDYSSQGERPRYGRWPPRDEDVTREAEFLVNQAGQALDAMRAHENAVSGEEEEEPASPASPATHEEHGEATERHETAEHAQAAPVASEAHVEQAHGEQAHNEQAPAAAPVP
ncbi:MAG: DUF882 domain-containing protein [Deltaproteobacteria bacterium]